MPKVSYVYCDANVFLAYFNAEVGRIDILTQLFEEIHKDNQRKIVTSVISITEVSHVAAEKTHHQLNQQIYDAIENFWNDTSLIEFVDVNESTARQARDLIREAIASKYTLRPNDALHLVSAKFVGINEFFTYDQKLHKLSDIMGYAILEPYVRSPQLPFTFSDEEET